MNIRFFFLKSIFKKYPAIYLTTVWHFVFLYYGHIIFLFYGHIVLGIIFIPYPLSRKQTFCMLWKRQLQVKATKLYKEN